jgi:hypothetical protein
MTSTPWGKADHKKVYARGITFYSTPGHGGFKLSATLNAQVPQTLKDTTWGGLGHKGWYEEDCDWAIVALVFPQVFTIEGQPDVKSIELARNIFKTYHPEVAATFLK